METTKNKSWTFNSTGTRNIKYIEMKESTLIKMQYDIKLIEKALVVALYRLEKLEKPLKKTLEKKNKKS